MTSKDETTQQSCSRSNFAVDELAARTLLNMATRGHRVWTSMAHPQYSLEAAVKRFEATANP